MSEPDFQALSDAVRDLVRPYLERSPEARRVALLLGEWLLHECRRAEAPARTETDQPASAPMPAIESQSAAPSTSPAPVPAPGKGATSRGIVPLNIGGATVHIEVAGATSDLGRARLSGGAIAPDPDDAAPEPADRELDLSLIERRCRLKAASCLLFIKRRAAERDPELEPQALERMHRMIETARSMRDCFLWVFLRERTPPGDEALRTIASCYEAHADAAALVARATELYAAGANDDLEQAMRLFTEANSALRVALEDSWLTIPDTDQDEGHHWLRYETKRRSIYIERFMRLDDPADPGRAQGVSDEVRALRAEVERRAQARAELEASFKRIRYHALKIAADTAMHDPHDRAKVVDEIAKLVEAGVPASDRRFGEVIPPAVAGMLADEPADTARAVGGYILHRDAQRADGDAEPTRPRAWSDRVLEARALLAGGRLVIVGGEPNTDAEARISEALRVGVEWVRLTEHGTGEPMRAPIFRPDTVCVLVLIKLCGHLHAEEACDYAREAGKACVYIRAGYNPEQIAEAVLQQASRLLEDLRSVQGG